MDSASRKADRGFTLIELLIVIAITGVMLAMAMPSMNRMVANSQISAATELLFASIQRARSEAITLRSVVSICRSSDPNAAAPACSGAATSEYAGADWAAGWIVFAKGPANDHTTILEVGDSLIARQGPFGSGPADAARAVVWSNASPQQFSFGPVGLMGATARTFRIDYASAPLSYAGVLQADRAVCLPINILGRVRKISRGAAGCAPS